jgi:hypothetical protein
LIRLVLSGLLLFCASFVHAAAPTLTGLYPAGGQRGTTIEGFAIGTFESWPVKFWTSSPLITVTPGKDKGKLSIKLSKDLIPGTYWLRCYDAQGASGLRPFIVGTLPEVMEVEPNDTQAKSQVASLPVVINGKLNRNGDLDSYAVTLKKGDTLVANVESHHVLRSAADMVMQLTNANGTVLTQNHDYHGLDPQLDFTATETGTYYVRLFAFPANPDSSIRYSGGELYFYRLTLTTGPFIDHVLPLATAKEHKELVRLLGWNLGSQTQAGMLQLDEEQTVVYHPEAAGQAMVRLEKWPVIDTTLPLQTSVTAAVPFSLTASLTRQKPAFQTKVMLSKGKKYYLQALSQTLELDTDPVLTITDATGKIVHQAEAAALHADVMTSHIPASDGIFTIAVRDLHDRYGWRHHVFLRIFPAEPSYSISVDADRFTLTPGKHLDIPVKVSMLDGWKEPVQISLVDLPSSVKWKVQSTSTKDAVTTITLRLENSIPGNASFRIIGQSKDVTKNATATLADLGTMTKTVWLTTLK